MAKQDEFPPGFLKNIADRLSVYCSCEDCVSDKSCFCIVCHTQCLCNVRGTCGKQEKKDAGHFDSLGYATQMAEKNGEILPLEDYFIGELKQFPGVTAYGKTRELCLDDMISCIQDIAELMLQDGKTLPDIFLNKKI